MSNKNLVNENNENGALPIKDVQEVNQPKKEKKSKKEKKPSLPKTKGKIIPKFYGVTNIQKLPKIPKGMISDIEKMPVLTVDQMEKYLTAVILGLIPDKFGLEVGADTKIKALAELSKLKQQAQLVSDAGEEERQILDAKSIVFAVKQPTLFESDIDLTADDDEDDEEEGNQDD